MKFVSKRIVAAILCGALAMPMTMASVNAKIKVTIEAPKPGEGIQEANLGSKKATGISTKTKVSVKKGKKKTLKVTVKPTGASQKVTYKSSNKKIVTVTKKGVIKGLKKGKAKITIKTTDGSNKKKIVTVTVK